jgi:hypothetical protein
VDTGRQLKQNLMGSENCEPTLATVPAKAPPGTSYCGLSFPRSWGRFFALLPARWKLNEGADRGESLAIEALSGNPKKMADSARPVRDFQPPFGAIAKPCDGVADHVSAGPCGLAPSRVIIR